MSWSIRIPDLTEDNHIFSIRPVNPGIIKRTEEQLGTIPDAVKSVGKLFRKYVGNLLLGNIGTVKRMSGTLSIECEIAATKFFSSIGVLFLVWPNAQTAPNNGEINIAVLRDDVIRIVKIETVELDSKGKYVNGSNRTVKQYE